MPEGASSFAKHFVSISTPALDTEYATEAHGRRLQTDEMFTIAGLLPFFSNASAALQVRKVPVRFAERTRFQSEIDEASTPPAEIVPADVTSPSSCPYFSST